MMSEVDVYAILDEVLNHQRERDSAPRKRVAGVFYPSEAMQCQRKIFMNVMRPEESAKETFPLGLFAMAKAVEGEMTSLLKIKYPLLVHDQVRVDVDTNGFTIHGYADVVLKNGDGKVVWVGEIKSTRGIEIKKKEGVASNHHRAQLHLYLNFLKCWDGAVVYVERGDLLKLVQFDEQLDLDFVDKILKHFESAHVYIKDDEVPPPMPVEQWECRYCAFQKSCTEDRKGKYKRTTKGWVKK